MNDKKIIHGLTVKQWKRNIDEYIETRDLKVKVCRYCGSFYLEGKWINEDVDFIIRRIISRNINKLIKVKYPFVLNNYKIKSIDIGSQIIVDLEVTASLEGEFFTIDKKIVLNIVSSICPRCFAKKVKTYDTIIQIRSQTELSGSDRRRVYEIIKELPHSIKDEIIDIKSTKDGIDILLNDKGLGRYIAKVFERKLGAHISESYKLVSRKPDGKTKSKLSISVRIPPSSKFLMYDHRGHLLFVYAISSNGFLAYDFDSEKYTVVPFKKYWRWGRKTIDTPWQTMRVIGLSKNNKLILIDENDYNVYEGKPILDEKFFKGEEVSVIEYKGKIYVIKSETLEGGLRNGEEKEEKKK